MYLRSRSSIKLRVLLIESQSGLGTDNWTRDKSTHDLRLELLICNLLFKLRISLVGLCRTPFTGRRTSDPLGVQERIVTWNARTSRHLADRYWINNQVHCCCIYCDVIGRVPPWYIPAVARALNALSTACLHCATVMTTLSTIMTTCESGVGVNAELAAARLPCISVTVRLRGNEPPAVTENDPYAQYNKGNNPKNHQTSRSSSKAPSTMGGKSLVDGVPQRVLQISSV